MVDSVWLITLPLPFAHPVTFGDDTAVHVNVVPATFFGLKVMFMIAGWPLQTVVFDALADGCGLTVTTRSTGNPLHPLKLGVILYVTVPDTLPVFTGASVTDPDPLTVTLPGAIGPLMVLVQENVAPPIVDVGTKARACPLQICCEYDAALFVITGTGFTEAVTLKVGPGQPFAEGVMV